MKKILIIAGPNGAGKTTFAEEFLPYEAHCPEFVNADLIAAGLSPFQPGKAAFAAGRIMLARIRELVAAGDSFAFETTLATRAYLRLIPQWQDRGYRVKLSFLKLPDPDFAIRRVEHRVRLGGHDIPAPVIRRRFKRGWDNLRKDYLARVNEWAIYDAAQSPARLTQTGDNRTPGLLLEDVVPYLPDVNPERPVTPLEDSDFIGAEAALKRAAVKALERARAAGLEPVVSENTPKPSTNTPR